jgi:hypothetical protein
MWIRDPGWKKLDPGSGMEKIGSGINITDPQRCLQAVSTIIKNATWWMHEVVPKLYKPEPQVGEHSF